MDYVYNTARPRLRLRGLWLRLLRLRGLRLRLRLYPGPAHGPARQEVYVEVSGAANRDRRLEARRARREEVKKKNSKGP